MPLPIIFCSLNGSLVYGFYCSDALAFYPFVLVKLIASGCSFVFGVGLILVLIYAIHYCNNGSHGHHYARHDRDNIESRYVTIVEIFLYDRRAQMNACLHQM